MRARAVASGGLALVILAGGAAAGTYFVTQRNNGNPPTSPASQAANTAAVQRTDLTTTETVSGTLEYTGSHNVTSQLHGTLTATAPEGSTVTRGQRLYEVDGAPVVLMYGERPAWRTLAVGVSDGPDVKQLDDNLIALGYATTSNLTPSNTFTDADAAAVKRWQKALGVEQTGRVELGAVVFLPGPIRIASHKLAVGEAVQPGAIVSTATDTNRVVDIALDTSKQALVKAGDPVNVTLPSGSSVAGTISTIAAVAKSNGSGNGGGGGGGSTIAVTVTLADQSQLGTLDQAPVDVVITTQSVKNVLAVPVNALTVLPDGKYAVDVVDNGTRKRIPVTTGLFTSSLVEVSGDGLREGQSVEVPSA